MFMSKPTPAVATSVQDRLRVLGTRDHLAFLKGPQPGPSHVNSMYACVLSHAYI